MYRGVSLPAGQQLRRQIPLKCMVPADIVNEALGELKTKSFLMRKKYKHLSKEEVLTLNRQPASLAVVDLADELLDLSKEEIAELHKECRKRLGTGIPEAKLKPIPGLSARAPFPHPQDYFDGRPGRRTLPVPYSAFTPGIHLPPVSPYFGIKSMFADMGIKLRERAAAEGEGASVEGGSKEESA